MKKFNALVFVVSFGFTVVSKGSFAQEIYQGQTVSGEPCTLTILERKEWTETFSTSSRDSADHQGEGRVLVQDQKIGRQVKAEIIFNNENDKKDNNFILRSNFKTQRYFGLHYVLLQNRRGAVDQIPTERLSVNFNKDGSPLSAEWVQMNILETLQKPWVDRQDKTQSCYF